ncbi:MAG TPA: peptidoglycan DD-metalloendopeptidase family protein [Propionicimonas sp.]|jgi:murein DD-endopeptidase MepM/ murein hydrolase activator NlpD
MAKLRVLVAGVIGWCLVWGVAPPAAGAASAVPPLPGPVVRGFDPPDQPWLAGHRGVDLLGAVGADVVAAMAGRVVFAGTIAGRGVIVVSHGALRTTYLPVSPTVAVGAQVGTGQVIGRLTRGHGCPGGTCLHWGLKRGEAYLDPLSLLDAGPVRLLPATSVDLVGSMLADRTLALTAGGPLPGLLTRPVPGAIGSGFGVRLHPIFGEWRLHDGVDLSAGCGTPIRAAADARVASVSRDPASGNRLELDHGQVGGHHLVTIYLHAKGYSVRAGATVRRGQVVGRVGSTGWSTGCHLHFTVRLDGSYADPERFL